MEAARQDPIAQAVRYQISSLITTVEGTGVGFLQARIAKELVWGGGSLVVRQSRDWSDTIFAGKKRSFGLNFRAETTVLPRDFLFGRRRVNFLGGGWGGGGYNLKTGWPVTIMGHIQACPTSY